MTWVPVGGEERLSYKSLTSHVILTAAGLWICMFWFGSWVTVVAILGEGLKNGGVTLAVLCRIPDAVATLREEQRRLRDERDAFQKFARRVASLEDASSQMGSASPDRSAGSEEAMILQTDGAEPVSPDSLERVQEIYRDTVMAVPHYEEDYDESLKTNMATEFGPEIAEAVVTGETFTPQLKIVLVQSAQQAHQERAGFLRLLEYERENLTSAKRSLHRLHDNVDAIEKSLQRRSARELIEHWKQLDEFEETCRDILRERQSQLHETVENRSDMEAQEYLHQTVDWTYPMLNDGLDCVSRIRDVKRDVVAELSKWR